LILENIFSPIAKLTPIIFILFSLDTFDVEVEKMDMNTLLIHVDLEEEIYMKAEKVLQ
jgi:hypothetical protein